MLKTKTISTLALTGIMLATSACSSFSNKGSEVGRLTRNFDMVDRQDGKRYGVVEMDPAVGGKVYDADGRLIGIITPPSLR